MNAAIDKHWIDILSALLTPTVAALGIYIAWQQFRVNKARLKHELFERRYAMFEATRDYLGRIRGSGRFNANQQFDWLQSTRGSRFLFDESIADLFEQIFKLGSKLEYLQDEIDNTSTGPEKSALLQESREIKNSLESILVDLEEKFLPYLRLVH